MVNGFKMLDKIEDEEENPILTMVSNEAFATLPQGKIGWPKYCTITMKGEILIWPLLDTRQVQIEIHLC